MHPHTLWAAVLPSPADPASPPSPETLRGTAVWALQYTPRVAIAEESVLAELGTSARLFGGRRALRARVAEEAQDLGVERLAWAPTSLAALAVARAGGTNGFARPLAELLDALPLETLSAARLHRATLGRLGCRTLGDVRRLPRGGVSRRFDAELLAALDMAYGLRPPAHTWETLPETFRATLELPARIDLAPALLFGARRLLVQLCGWLAARRAGTTAITLHWMHDVMRPKDAGTAGALTVRTAEPMRDVEHLCRLLAEHLARVTLAAPVGDLALTADEVHALHEHSADLIPQASAPREALGLVLERVAARLGPDRVLQPVMREDHRIEWTARWTAWPATPAPAGVRIATDPQPTWLLPKPLRLAVRDDRPLYQGPLQLLVGPQRIETGWWHAAAPAQEDTGAEAATHKALRDYWVAANEHAGVLWVYQERFGGDRAGWWLHGIFA